jgi:two-component system response regulator NreC
MTRTRVVLVDDHELFRTGVRHVLMSTGEFEPVGEARTARAAFALIDATRADVVLMDVSLPGMDGVVATREVRRRAPETRVLIMSAHDQVRDVLEALSAGASGYIIKSEAPETLLSALRAVARGETYLASGLSARIAAHRAAQPTGDVLDVLSEREREVFRLAAECLPARDIARELCIARKTVDTHLNRIHRKLGSRTLAELVGMSTRLGLSHTGLARHQVVVQERNSAGELLLEGEGQQAPQSATEPPPPADRPQTAPSG